MRRQVRRLGAYARYIPDPEKYLHRKIGPFSDGALIYPVEKRGLSLLKETIETENII